MLPSKKKRAGSLAAPARVARVDSAPRRQLCHSVRAQLHNAADSKAPKQIRGVSRLRRYSAHLRHVAAHSPVCVPPLKSLPAATRSPLLSLSAICPHAWVAPLTCALSSVGNSTICTFTSVSIDSPRQHFANQRAAGPAPSDLPVPRQLLPFQRHEHPTVPSGPACVAPPSCPECWCEGSGRHSAKR